MSWIILAIALRAASPSGAQYMYCEEVNTVTVDGAVGLARQLNTLTTEDFENGLAKWEVLNYEKKLTIGIQGQGDAGQFLGVTSHGTKGDTAFELTSKRLPIPGGARFRFQFSWRANRSFATLVGHKGLYMTQLQWLDAGGNAVGFLPFTFGKSTQDWQSKTITGVAPQNAAVVVIRFGCDHPNIGDGEYLDIDNLLFETETIPARFQSGGHIVSRPFRVSAEKARRLSWEADVPAGTSIQLKVASAPDDGGGPGLWSDPLGPDGRPKSSFSKAGVLPAAHNGRPWVRYVALLKTNDPSVTPILKRVKLGEATDGPWVGPDRQAPVVSERSTTRTGDAEAPIWFRLSDGTGVDHRTLRVRLDGKAITKQLAVEDGRYLYRPPEPLTPQNVDIPPTRWRVTNYARALTIERPTRRRPDLPSGFHVTREAGDVDTAFRIQSPRIPVSPGATYRLSYWSRHSMNLTGAMNGKGAWSGGVTWLAPDGTYAGGPAPIDLGDANPEWHRDDYQLTAPKGAADVQIAFGFDNPNIANGGFVDITEIAFEGPRPNRKGHEPNLHRVDLSVADFAGNRLDRKWYILIRPPRSRSLVTLRDDGTVLVDGEPFFPIGLYAVWKKAFNENSFDKAFRDMKAAGFNMAHTYSSTRGPDFADFYAAAQRHGIKLYVASGAGANCADTDTVIWDVVREEGQPALLAWYLADDTASSIGHNELRTLSEAIHDVDPAHITVQADGVGGPPVSRYARYVGSTDGFLPELYPIRDDTAKGVPRIIADMKTIRADLTQSNETGKTVWAIVQYFQGWGWPRYPTREELWAMSYLSIIHGANGITWYTYGGWGDNHGVTDYTDKWRNICALARELAQLQEVLTEPTGAQPPRPIVVEGPKQDALGYPSISALLKEHDGRRYLLAANSAKAEVRAELRLAVSARVQVPFEDREIAGSEQGFSDTFGPYGVHVYVWSP